MKIKLNSRQTLSILSGLSGVAGVILLSLSFAIGTSPLSGAAPADLVQWGQQNYVKGLWAAWLRAVGPVLIVLFALSLVHLSGATHRLDDFLWRDGPHQRKPHRDHPLL